MTVYERAKETLKIVTELGTGTILGNVVTILLPGAALPVKACAYVASYVISSMLTEKTDDYIDRKSEEYKTTFEKVKKNFKEG